MPLLLLLTKTLHTTPRSLADRERDRERERERERESHTHRQHVQKHCVYVVGGVGKTDGASQWQRGSSVVVLLQLLHVCCMLEVARRSGIEDGSLI